LLVSSSFGLYFQEALEHGRPFIREQPLELDHALRPWVPHLGRYEPEHSHGDEVLVVGAVEDADHPALRALRVHPPEEVVGQLDRRRCLERRDTAALGIDAGEDVLDRAVLP
jgi:hypothetical protein